MPPIRQTQSYLRSLFAENGISPQRRLGQNFLIDLNIHDLIVKSAELNAGDVILEVGPGAGALTSLMAAEVAAVVAVEVDRTMARLTTHATAGLENVRVLNLDALAGKNTINPAVLDQVRSALAGGEGRRFKLVANLPYHVATPLITNFLVHPDLCPELLVVTIQREMADRLCATPATPAYGAVSVVVQALADVSLIRSLPPSVFWPRPKVDSAVLPSGPVRQGEPVLATSPGFSLWCARFSSIVASTCGTPWLGYGPSAGPRLRSIDGLNRGGKAARFAPRHSAWRNSSRWHTDCANDSVYYLLACREPWRNPSTNGTATI